MENFNEISFNGHEHNHNHNHNINTRIEVNRAPTDESVSLLNEFTDKAKDNILDSFRVKSTLIDSVIFVEQVPPSISRHLNLKFNINGEEFIIRDIELPYTLKNKYDIRNYAVNELFNQISEKVAIEILKESKTLISKL